MYSEAKSLRCLYQCKSPWVNPSKARRIASSVFWANRQALWSHFSNRANTDHFFFSRWQRILSEENHAPAGAEHCETPPAAFPTNSRWRSAARIAGAPPVTASRARRAMLCTLLAPRAAAHIADATYAYCTALELIGAESNRYCCRGWARTEACRSNLLGSNSTMHLKSRWPRNLSWFTCAKLALDALNWGFVEHVSSDSNRIDVVNVGGNHG